MPTPTPATAPATPCETATDWATHEAAFHVAYSYRFLGLEGDDERLPRSIELRFEPPYTAAEITPFEAQTTVEVNYRRLYVAMRGRSRPFIDSALAGAVRPELSSVRVDRTTSNR